MANPERVGVSAQRNEQTEAFWHWAEAEKERAPESVLPLIARQAQRITVPYVEAVKIAAWARDLIGWEPAQPKPLRFSDRTTGETIEPPE